MFAEAFGGIVSAFSSAFGGPYHAAVARWPGVPVLDDGGSILTPGVPIEATCLCQVDAVTDAMRGDVGFVQGDVRLLVLAFDRALDTDAVVHVTAGPTPGVYSVQAVSRDPVGAGWDARGRRV